MELDKAQWKEEHLSRMHHENFEWCPLCVARKLGEENPPQHLVPPQQDPSQKDMDYVKEDYKPDDEKFYGRIVDKKGGKVVSEKTKYEPVIKDKKRK